MNEQAVSHRGTIVAVNGHDVTLLLDDTGSRECGGCRLAAVCSRPDATGRVTVTVDSVRGLAPGMKVTASVGPRSQGLAILWVLVMPLIILAGVILPLAASSMARWAVVAVAVACVGLYNLLLWRFGPKLSRSIRWTLTPAAR